MAEANSSVHVPVTPQKDRYGFNRDDTFHVSLTLSDDETKKRNIKERERELKWIHMMKSWYQYSNEKNYLSHRTLKSRLRKGVPDAVRVAVWKYYLRYDDVKRKYGPPPSDEKLKRDLPDIVVEDIEKDIDRTFPTHSQFENGSAGQRDLKHLLECYAAVDPQTSYCQGMSFVAAFLLTYMVPEEAYYCFVSVMMEHSYKCRLLYQPNMYETQCILHVFDRLGERYLPSLWKHLSEQNMSPSMYATEWFMTLFCRGFSFDLVTRAFDLFVSEGMKTYYRICLALMKSIEAELLEAPFEEIMGILRHIPGKCDSEVVLKIAFTIPLRRCVIVAAEAEFVGIYEVREAERAANRQRRAASNPGSPTASARSGRMSPAKSEQKGDADDLKLFESTVPEEENDIEAKEPPIE
jgi:TBC1 domain family member 10